MQGATVEQTTPVEPKQKPLISIPKIALAVFLGMWMFALSAGMLVLLLRATGDLPR